MNEDLRTSQKAFEIPILETLIELGGSATPQQVYEYLQKKVKLLPGDWKTRPDGRTIIWKHNVAWVRWRLVQKGEIDRSQRGIWKITEKGKRRYEEEKHSYSPSNFKPIRIRPSPKRIKALNLPHPSKAAPEFLQKWATEQGLNLFELDLEGTRKKYAEYYAKKTELPDRHYLKIIKRLVVEIKSFLNGTSASVPSEEKICQWIDYCYLFEMYWEGAELFHRVSPDAVSEDLYRRTKKIAEACKNRL